MLLVDFEQFVRRAGFEGCEFGGFGVGIAGLSGFPAVAAAGGGEAGLRVVDDGGWVWM